MMLGAREAFFTELPRRGLLGNWAQSRSYRSGDIDSGGRVGLVVGVLGQALFISQAPAALLDPERPRAYQGVFLYRREIERVGYPVGYPYEKVHGYLASFSRHEVFKKERTVTGTLG
jgi:hypothetical protein